jgi:hypothetical protein
MIVMALLCFLQAIASPVAAASDAAIEYDKAEGLLNYHLAGAAYCSASDVQGWNCSKCLASKLASRSIKIFIDSKTDSHAYVAALADATGAVRIVLSFRGTESLTNWIENLKIAKTDKAMSCDGCKVHSGFYQSWAAVADDVVAEIRSLRSQYPDAPIFTTGHSLGAALAHLSAYVLQYDESLPIAGVYSYGSPRLGNKAFANFYNNQSDTHVTWRHTHHHDPVVHVPTETLLGFFHVAREVFWNEDSTSYTLCDGSGEDETCADQYSLLEATSISDHLHYFAETIGEDGCT